MDGSSFWLSAGQQGLTIVISSSCSWMGWEVPLMVWPAMVRSSVTVRVQRTRKTRLRCLPVLLQTSVKASPSGRGSLLISHFRPPRFTLSVVFSKKAAEISQLSMAAQLPRTKKYGCIDTTSRWIAATNAVSKSIPNSALIMALKASRIVSVASSVLRALRAWVASPASGLTWILSFLWPPKAISIGPCGLSAI